jgi:outer membrane protein OmpA-like peptidoglycan-associated protein
MICLIGCFLFALTTLRAQGPASPDSTRSPMDTTGQTEGSSVISRDTTETPARDTTFKVRDTTMQIQDTVISLADDPAPKHDTTIYASSKPENADKAAVPAKDTATNEDKSEETSRQLDTRWFISPLLKLQFQDFAMLEKNRKGYLSDANTLPFFNRGNASFAASAYKNITSRLSASADIGLSFGHVTNNNVLISQTKSKTFNLLNAAIYYHLLAPSYRLQPYVTVGINNIINDASYASVPMGIGAKFNAKKIMVTGQVMYGYGLSKSIAHTTMYSLGIYIPIKNKKQKQLDQDDNSPYNKKDDKKKDTANKNNNGGVTNNIYITINMDSVLRSKGLLDENGNPTGRNNGGDGDNDGGSGGNGRRGGRGKHARTFHDMDLDDFSDDDYRIDSLDGRPVLRFVVYFEFNEYGLTTHAFGNIDKVIGHLKRTNGEFNVEIKGYTDSVGTDSYNNMLSRRRAKMVLDYMNSRGVPTELMKAKAYGSDNPVGSNSDPNQAWLNRRAEIIVHQKDIAASGK